MRKLLALTLTIWLSVFVAATANASGGGGQVNKPVSGTVIQTGTCEAILPPGIDTEKCNLVAASDVSGIATYICPEGIYLCDNSTKEKSDD